MEELKAGSWDDVLTGNFEKQEVQTEEHVVQDPPPTPEVVQENQETQGTEHQETDTQQTQVEVKEVEKIVEKIIEKHPEFKDDYSKTIYEALLEGKEDVVYNYLQEKYKDYDTMSDVDVVREKLKKDNPTWSDKDINSELKFKYGKGFEKINTDEIDKEVEPETYQRALQHNEEIERRELMLERDGRDARNFLNQQKKTIELPKIKEEATQEQQSITPEQQAQLTQEWMNSVVSDVPKMEDLKWDVEGEEVVYKFTEEDKKSQVELMKEFNDVDYFKKRGWFDENGTLNAKKIAEDVYILDNLGKIIKSTGTQIKNATKKEIVSKDIKNLDTETKTVTVSAPTQSFGDYVLSL